MISDSLVYCLKAVQQRQTGPKEGGPRTQL